LFIDNAKLVPGEGVLVVLGHGGFQNGRGFIKVRLVFGSNKGVAEIAAISGWFPVSSTALRSGVTASAGFPDRAGSGREAPENRDRWAEATREEDSSKAFCG
jgi:hypothetical protein